MAHSSVPFAGAGRKMRAGKSPAERDFDPGNFGRYAVTKQILSRFRPRGRLKEREHPEERHRPPVNPAKEAAD